MPTRAKVPCRYPLCSALVSVDVGYCAEHAQIKEEARRERIGKTAERGYGARWQRVSRLWLRKHPLCAECQRAGRVKAATVVDHIEPHRGDMKLFWNRSNWQPLCVACHGRKSIAEGGGYGGKISGSASPMTF